MRILITGNTSALSQRLYANLSKNHTVFLTGRDDKADVYLDLSEFKKDPVNLPDSIDVIIHCAASFKGNSIKDSMENELINSLGSLKIMQVAELTKCNHLIYISSIFVHEHINNEYFGSYGLSKRHGQENLKYLCSMNGLKFTALMITQIYDEKLQFRKHQGMFYRIIENAFLGQNISIYGSKDQLRNFLHVDDLVRIIAKVIDTQLLGEYNCLFPVSYKLSEIASLALSIFNNGGSIKFLKDKPDIPSVFIPDDFSIYELIDFWPVIDLETGINMLKLEYEKKGRA